jgi:DNA-binding GntR family transcriptional regulator
MIVRMERLTGAGSFTAWEAAHQHFHASLVVGAGKRTRARIAFLGDGARRYRHALATMGTRAIEGFAHGAKEHREIVLACEQRDAELAGWTLATHLARTALSLISAREPSHEPTTLREALRLVV